MEADRSKRIRAIAASLMIHALVLAAFVFSHSSPKQEVCMVVPIDEANPPFPLYEETIVPDKPKPVAAPPQKESIPAAPPRSSADNGAKNPEPIVPPTAEQKIIEAPPQNEPPRLEPARPAAESSLSLFREPMDRGGGSGSNAGTPAGSSFGSGGGSQSGTSGNGAAGSGGAGHSSGNEVGNANFGSPMGPKFRYRKMPEYPMAARKQKKAGSVVLAVTIDKNGDLKDIEVLEASDPLFIKPSLDALKKSSFLPANRNGTPITVKAILPIRFALQD